MHRTYAVLGYGIVLLGIVHTIAATRIFSGLTANALWFISGGIAMALTGALNLLNNAYGRDARGVRRVCVATNLVMLVFGITSGIVTKATPAELVIVLGLLGGVTLLSVMQGRARA